MKRDIVTQIPDGQIQASPAAPVGVEAAPVVPAAVPAVVESPAITTDGAQQQVTQIEDGQIQAGGSAAPAPVAVKEAAPAAAGAFSSYYYYKKTVEEVPGPTICTRGPIQAHNHGEIHIENPMDIQNEIGIETPIDFDADFHFDHDVQVQRIVGESDRAGTIATGPLLSGPIIGAAQVNDAACAMNSAPGAPPIVVRRQVTQIADGQIQATADIPTEHAVTDVYDDYSIKAPAGTDVVTQIPDGQIQSGVEHGVQHEVEHPVEDTCHGPVSHAVTQIPDGQIQSSIEDDFSLPDYDYNKAADYDYNGPITQIPDGQIQSTFDNSYNDFPVEHPVTQIPDGQIQAGVGAVEHQVDFPANDHYIKASEGAVTQIPDGQIQAPIADAPVEHVVDDVVDYYGPNEHAVTQIPDGQIQAIDNVHEGKAVDYDVGVEAVEKAPVNAVTQIPDGQIQALRKRQNGVPLALTLDKGVLKDAQGRIGYIADNRQFQFDGPPQSGAVFTGGWSVCEDGALALGSQKEFWACGSSDC